MADVISRTNSDMELDSHRLQSVLDSITSDLTMPFLERRARSKSHKKTTLEELNAVIQELTERERELQAAVGIAKMLLERNDILNKKIQEIRTKKRYYKDLNKEFKNENEALKNEIIATDEKYQQVNAALVASEEQQIILLAEHKRIIRENSSKKELAPNALETYEAEVSEIISKHKEQYDYMMSNC
jgi:DNA repair exonuclease SbcCD ATPase subunit